MTSTRAMVHRFAGVCAVGILCSGAAAEIIDFDDVNLGGLSRANFPALGIDNSYRGYMWPSNNDSTFGEGHWAAVDNTDGDFGTIGAYSGTQSAWNWNGPLHLDIVFDQDKVIEGAAFNVFSAGQDWGADRVRIEGYDSGGGLVGMTGWLELDDSSSAPQWGWLDAGNMTGVRTMTIRVEQDDSVWAGAGWFAVDDITIRNVPSPAGFALLGVAGLLGARRRRG